jgi:exopolyphosphatase/guanosine-5'-triphosphate,3'-diphosphate pyrophosphatase
MSSEGGARPARSDSELPPGLEALAERQKSMVGVIDIGSNSLRLVLYDRLSRAPVALFNEKVMCALGRGLNATGRLNPDGVILAKDNIERFVLLSRRLGLARLDILATSAVRDASDGPAFVADIEARLGVKIMVIDGLREARLAASGVRAGIPSADGITGDLGGGSVELAVTGPWASGYVVSLPIGPLRLIEGSGDELRPRAVIDAALAGVPWLGQGRGKPFYAVGGTWRTLARIHMEQQRYPLHILQNYELPATSARGFLEVVDRLSRRSAEKMVGISRRRLETVPMAAYLLHRLLLAIEPSTVIFSAYGLREGHLFEQLSTAEQSEDPLLVATLHMAQANPRFGAGGEELVGWAAPLLPAASPSEARLQRASAILSDLGWNEHPDYRAEQVFMRCLRMPVPGLDHAGRVFIAAALHARYGGNADDPALVQVRPLLDPAMFTRARSLGVAFRLGYTLTGGAPGLIRDTSLSLEGDVVMLTVPEHTAIYTGEAVQRRLEALGRALGRRATVRRAG